MLYILAFYNLVVFYNDEPIAKIEDFVLGHISGSEYEITIGAAKLEYLPTNAYNNIFYGINGAINHVSQVYNKKTRKGATISYSIPDFSTSWIPLTSPKCSFYIIEK